MKRGRALCERPEFTAPVEFSKRHTSFPSLLAVARLDGREARYEIRDTIPSQPARSSCEGNRRVTGDENSQARNISPGDLDATPTRARAHSPK